jgi:hypothetical protein
MPVESYTLYELTQLRKLKNWERRMKHRPNLVHKLSAGIQQKINDIIPEKLHETITVVIRKMIEAVLFGSEFVKPSLPVSQDLQEIEKALAKRLEYYRSTAALEGGVTGFSGFVGSLADFPLLLAIKIKYLFDVAALYGRNTAIQQERLFLLYVFQLAFSSPVNRPQVFQKIAYWKEATAALPSDLSVLNWREFQQQYRDYIDIAKLAQMLPGIGAAVGVVVNYRLLTQLSNTAIMCYRERWFAEK